MQIRDFGSVATFIQFTFSEHLFCSGRSAVPALGIWGEPSRTTPRHENM